MSYKKKMQQLTTNLFFNAKDEDFKVLFLIDETLLTNKEDFKARYPLDDVLSSVEIKGDYYNLFVFNNSLVLKTKEGKMIFNNKECEYNFLDIALEKIKKVREKEQKEALLKLKVELIKGHDIGDKITDNGLWIAHYFLEDPYNSYHPNVSLENLIKAIKETDLELWDNFDIANLYDHGWSWENKLSNFINHDTCSKEDLDEAYCKAIESVKDTFEYNKIRVLSYLKGLQ